MLSVKHDDPLGFRFRGGRVSLDLVATLGWRYAPQPVERLTTTGRLSDWLREAGLAGEPVDASAADLELARRLREALWSLSRAALDATPPDPAAVELVNRVAAAARPARRLLAFGQVHAEPAGAGSLLSVVADDAVDLFGTPDVARLRECAREDCSLLFVDRSRAGRRRWCDMEACGNRAKTTGYRARRRSAS